MSSKTKTILYWIATLWLALGLVSTGMVQVLRLPQAGSISPPGTEGMQHLGLNVGILPLLGFWKLAAAVAVLVPGFVRTKEWAYAGVFFMMSGAIYMHCVVGDSLGTNGPALLILVLNLLSWNLRPASRNFAMKAGV